MKQQTNRSAGRTKKKKKRRSAGDYRLKVFAATAAVMVVALAGVWAVNAYLSAQTETATNTFSPQQYTYTDIGISEPGGTGYTINISGTTGTLKSGTNNKSAKVTVSSGEDKKPVFIRATLVMNIYASNGANITADCLAAGIEPDYTINTTDWTGIDGAGGLTYYYYNGIVIPGDETSNLITNVDILNATDLPDGSSVEVDVIADAVQAVSYDGQDWNASHYTTAEINKAWGVTPTTMTYDDSAFPGTLTETELVALGRLSGVTLTWGS